MTDSEKEFTPTTEQYEALRQWCAWNLGDPYWAGRVVDVLNRPKETLVELKAEKHD